MSTYQYDGHDNLIALTDAKGQTHRFEYDLASRKLKETRPLGGVTSYTYDAVGRLLERTDATGNERRFTYDAAGRKVEETQTAAGQTTPSQNIRYEYDDADRLIRYTQAGDTLSSATYTVDALGRVTTEALTYGSSPQAITTTIQHAYTPDGRRQSLIYPDGSAQTNRYAQGRLQGVNVPGETQIRWSLWQWQQPTRIDFPGVTRRIDYDPLQRMTRLQVQAQGSGNAEAPTGPLLFEGRYTYDAAGNLHQKETPEGPTTYNYDTLSRLTEVTPPPALEQSAAHPEGLPVERYTYDAVHNRLSSAHQPGVWAYNADNQLIHYGQGDSLVALGYLASGHQASVHRASEQTDYRYDAAERLRRLERNGRELAAYQYDPFGRRIAKTVNGQTTWYLYAPEGLLAELNATGQLTRAYGWQPDAPFGTAPLWQAEVSGSAWQVHFLQTDHLGTPQLATNAQSQRTWQAQQEAFGLTTPDPHSTLTVNLRFPGQYYDEESGLHYNYYRDYDPQTARYVQSDPIGLRGGINTYGYVGEIQ